ncbi:hypothetical protein MPH_02307 [Macrophomina phaseolina MS6]|uniref:Uncharacterized protein n=1 Tax=Macrophomina phaseolina (strain MS6) TaxID=1126212 RepID=K2S5S9_MACPH|nr:hypothetical protein MPH_02307 [Macrophomina phaseolina MS6]
MSGSICAHIVRTLPLVLSWCITGGWFAHRVRSIKLKHSIRPPKRSEIHIYDLPVYAHANGLTKIELTDTRIATRAARELDGSRMDPRQQATLIVRRYCGAIPVEKTVKKRERVWSGQHSLPQRQSKRQRTGDEPSIQTMNGASVEQHAQSPFIFTAGTARMVEQLPEFEDISAEVEARLAEQAARRAAAKQKANGPPAGGKRKRSSGAFAGDLEAEGVEEGIKGMMLVDGRPKKRAKEGNAAADDGGAEEKSDAARPQESDFPKSRSKVRKERRRERRREGRQEGEAEESPRPMKRSRMSGGEGGSLG